MLYDYLGPGVLSTSYCFGVGVLLMRHDVFHSLSPRACRLYPQCPPDPPYGWSSSSYPTLVFFLSA
jgi:hypothetical protein